MDIPQLLVFQQQQQQQGLCVPIIMIHVSPNEWNQEMTTMMRQ